MTAAREDALARYDRTRASIERVLKLAERSCAKADWGRATKQVASGPWADLGALVAQDWAGAMIADVALFERNQRGRRVFDRFLSDRAQRLDPPDLALARCVADSAVFSIFRFVRKYKAAGLWVEDMLRAHRRLWLIDDAIEDRVPKGAIFATRVFEAGPFHARLGAVVPVGDDDLDLFVGAAEAGRPLPYRDPLAAMLYDRALSTVLR